MPVAPSARPPKYEPEQTCYQMAYYVLPEYVAHRRDKLVEELSAGRRGAAFFYVMTCATGEKEPDPDVAHSFDVHAGGLDDRHDYYVIQYPSPRPLPSYIHLPVDQLVEAMGKIVLAPYFSAVVVDRQSKDLKYFVLGQSPEGKTTLRTVNLEFNGNLGPGSAPELEPFLQLVREKLATGLQPVAGVRYPARTSPPGDAAHDRTGRGAPRPKRWWQFWK